MSCVICTQSLRQHVTVGQDPRLFNRSVAFNVSLGNPNISNNDILNALNGQCHAIVNKLPDGITAL